MERLKMTRPQMKDIEAVEKVPQAEKDAKHTERLYPSELDGAIVNENPLTYSKHKLMQIMLNEISDDLGAIEEYIDEEIKPLFNLI